MAALTTIPTKLKNAQMTGGPRVNFATDTFACLLVQAGSGAPNVTSTGIQFVADVTATNAEVIGSSYARQTLKGLQVLNDATNTSAVDFLFNPVIFVQDVRGFTGARYAVFYDVTAGSNDSNYPVVAITDLGSAQSSQNGSVTLTIPPTGFIQWQ